MNIYKTKKEAKEHANGFELAVKVEGGWAVMTYDDYEIWKNQK